MPAASSHEQLLAAVAFHRRGEFDKAEAAYRAIIAASPAHFDAVHLLGALLAARGREAEAETWLVRAVALNPKVAAAHNNLGNVVKALHGAAQSLPCYDKAIALDPRYADGFFNRGNVLAELGRSADALADYDRALAIDANLVTALRRSARVLSDLGRHEDALIRSRRALALDGNSADAWMRDGNILLHLKRPREALESFDRALAIDPQHAVCAVNRSAALDALGRPEDALAGLELALRLRPTDTGALNNMATILKSLGRMEESLSFYARALALAPDDAITQSNFAMTSLLMGDFERGWPALEHRWDKKDNARKRPSFPFTGWQGEALSEKRILIYAEQGLGDIVQFSRYLPMVAALGARVSFVVAGRIHAVLRAAFPFVALHEDMALVRMLRFDFQCAMMSLPLRFGTREDSIPVGAPYLKTDPARVARWRERIGSQGFKIGIAWQGNPGVAVDAGRSIAMAHFLPLASIQGVRLISLQKNEGSEQLGHDDPVEIPGPDFDAGPDAFLDTMALMESLDLVVTSDTSIAHVAGALGRPVWVALKRVPDWRWMLGRDDSPWYPTMRLFRQQTPGDWADVFARIGEALRSRASLRSA